jgi:hypothetical protein
MQKIKDKSKKLKSSRNPASAGIKVHLLQIIFNIPFEKFIFMIVLHNILNLLSLSFYPLSFEKFMNKQITRMWTVIYIA